MTDLTETTTAAAVFGEPTRVRLMSLLGGAELSVAEMVRITDLPQSRVSTHLGKLRDAGLLRDRKVGNSTYYRQSDASRETDAGHLWALLEPRLDDPVLRSDQVRAEQVVAGRDQGISWPDAVAGQMEHHYSPGRTWEATARGLLGVAALGDVLDVGSGDGVLAELLSDRARSITGVDRSPRVIEAARRRLAAHAHIRFVEGDMHALPLPDESFDQVLLFNVLTYAADPQKALAEAARVMRPGAHLSVVTLHEHTHADVSAAYGHLRCGFSLAELRALLSEAGLLVDRCQVTSRERRQPYFQVISAFARRRGPSDPVR